MSWTLQSRRPPCVAWTASRRLATFLIISLCFASPLARHLRAQPRGARTGAELYRTACATCHGPDGRGASRDHTGFDTPLPDFSDCRFATPEPDSDWIAVVHRGGRARAFDRRMPAFDEALTAREIAAVVGHLRTFCTDAAWPRGELNLPRPLFTEKAFPENEAVLTLAVDATGPGAFDQSAIYERRIGARTQIEIAAPFSAARQAGEWRAGFGDLALGVKHVLAHSLHRGAILTVGGELVLPTADESLGGGVTRAEPFIAAGQMLGADGFVQAHAGVELSSDRTRAAHEAFWRFAIGRSITPRAFGRTWTPMVELLAARELESGGRVEWDLAPQVQVTLSTRQHIMMSVGARIPLSQRDGRHPRVAAYLLWDWADGGLGSGW
jgi:mono/diheme cytochrome c family protein